MYYSFKVIESWIKIFNYFSMNKNNTIINQINNFGFFIELNKSMFESIISEKNN